MSTDFIRYDLLAQEALRGVIRRVLEDAARSGLPGEHHLYISFLTNAPGVRLSARMRERYPTEMTIVLQHQFWDLSVNEHAFEVGLSFGGVPEKLVVPFESISGFHDPSVNFGLKFEPAEGSTDASDQHPPVKIEAIDTSETAKSKPAVPTKPSGSQDAGSETEKDTESAPSEGAEVVSLDKFRKK